MNSGCTQQTGYTDATTGSTASGVVLTGVVMARKRPTKTAKKIESLLRQVRRMESRLYRFDNDIRQEIKNLSPQKARFFNTETLYKKATWLDDETGKILSGLEGRKVERQRAAQKAAETRKRKREEPITKPEEPEQQTQEEPFDITEDILDNFEQLVSFFNRPVPKKGLTRDEKEVPKKADLIQYAKSEKDFLKAIFEIEKGKDAGGLARRIYESSQEIDVLIGGIEYSMYKEDIQTAGNKLIKIIRGTTHLSREDREASESIADKEWTDYS